MNMKSRRTTAILASVALGSAVAVGLATALVVERWSSDASAEPIPVTEENVVIDDAGGVAEALEISSSKAGFRVLAPAFVPEGLELRSVNIEKGPPELPNRMTVVMLIYRTDDSATNPFRLMTVTEVNVRTEHPANHSEDPALDTNQLLDLERDDIEVWRSGADPRITYTVWTQDRSFYVVIEGKQQPSHGQLSRLFDGFLED